MPPCCNPEKAYNDITFFSIYENLIIKNKLKKNACYKLLNSQKKWNTGRWVVAVRVGTRQVDKLSNSLRQNSNMDGLGVYLSAGAGYHKS